MSKAVIIYDSKSGNTGMMAKAINRYLCNVREILKRRKKTYGNNEVLYPATIALRI